MAKRREKKKPDEVLFQKLAAENTIEEDVPEQL
jgi:hypothetical protein